MHFTATKKQQRVEASMSEEERGRYKGQAWNDMVREQNPKQENGWMKDDNEKNPVLLSSSREYWGA
ncbi:hypothetical protein GJ744_001107 [Endocarpon pusillum]|uniref:Uncharacterized protein n=1 Tax=Endocarpon pusillum TaxID=364733 RepID=A0A8H7AC17_9EURO|nr:hypothetical protein GJ744_001107 [Endocarpon pusillum]